MRSLQKGIVDLKPLVANTIPLEEMPRFMADATTGKVPGFIKGVMSYA